MSRKIFRSTINFEIMNTLHVLKLLSVDQYTEAASGHIVFLQLKQSCRRYIVPTMKH